MTLRPDGTLRARFQPTARTDMFRRLGIGARKCDLGDEGLYLAEELISADGWLGGSDPVTLGVLVLALMLAQRQGSTRLPLDKKGALATVVGDIARLAGLGDAGPLVKAVLRLTAELSFNSVIGAGDDRVPLIVDDGALYTERSRWLEQRVASRLAARIAAPPRDVASAVADVLARPGGRPLSAEQARAVGLALDGKLAVVTGGPGTGKTLVASAIVRGFARLGVAPAGIALAAQTGKAANRLTQVIGEQLAAIADPADADRALAASPPVAQTLHRLLGYSGGRFAHHAQSPLPVGAVIVDESSMIDLELMDALLDALPAEAPLVLIGDAHQLPAIDAGQILEDLAATDGPATARVGVLAHSYRMDTSDPAGRAVYEFSRVVHDGATERFVDKQPLAQKKTTGTLSFRGVEWVDTAAAKRPLDATLAIAEATWHHFDGPRALRLGDDVVRFVDGRVDPAHAPQLEALWAMLGRARILTVTRAMPTGAIEINAHLHGLALERMSMGTRPEFVPGEPVMITANDYQRGLFNGDQGVIVRADEGLGRHHYRAVFRVGGELRPFAIEALRDRLELSWALTVHKAQGSELDAVALLLPHDDLPLVTRELLYTAVTRARTGVVIGGARPILIAAGKRSALRYSGLANRLRAELKR